MTTLHILNASPAQATQLNSCLRILSAEDGIVLCGEAVQALRAGSVAVQQLLACDRAYRLYALEEDVLARAIDCAELPVILLDYSKFVAVCVEYTRVNSWT